jgi:hypothetical protein
MDKTKNVSSVVQNKDQCRLTLLNPRIHKNKDRSWSGSFQCECGSVVVIKLSSVRSGNTKSCGCLHKEKQKEVGRVLRTTHGKSKSKIYKLWKAMRYRCNNSNAKQYKDYGGRGITVHPDWDSFESFLKDMGAPPTECHTLERIECERKL